MSDDDRNILTPVGRLVQGSAFDPSKTDAEGNPLVIKHGPNAGQPRVDYFLAIAIPKTDPGVQALIDQLSRVAQAAFPQGQYNSPTFAWKYIDGDGVDKYGKPHSEKPGFAGCWVFKFSGGYAPKCYHVGHYQPHEQITDPMQLRRGYYVRIAGSVKGNDSQQQPGLYLNHSMLELVGYGEEIVTGPDASATFGNAPPPQLPAGASATPVAGQTPAAQPQGQQPAANPPQQPPAAQPQGQQPPAAAPQQPAAQPQGPAPTAPAHDFLNGPGAAPTTAAPVVKRYDSNGQAWTEDQLRAAKWTEQQIQAAPLAQ